MGAVYRFTRGRGGRNGRFRFSRALRPIDSEKLGISSGPLSSVRPFYVNAPVTLEFQERRKDSVTPLIFTRDNFPISRPVPFDPTEPNLRAYVPPVESIATTVVIKFPSKIERSIAKAGIRLTDNVSSRLF